MRNNVNGINLTVGIYQKYDYPNLLRQTPGQEGIWQGVRFLINKFSEPCDILVVLNRFYEDVKAECGEIWLIIQEPPIDNFPWVFEGHSRYAKIFSSVCSPSSHTSCKPSHGALPWHIDMTYDELKTLPTPEKNRNLSWITTNKDIFPGHRDRMEFLKKMRKTEVEFDLFGHGFHPIFNKYEGLARYRYSLAVENFSGLHYWTEKLADCYLSWTMPIYYGCTNLKEYFPEESFIQIDIYNPEVFEEIRNISKSDLYLKRREAIAEARHLVLDKYQLFPFIVNRIENKTYDRKIQKFYPYRESLMGTVRRRMRSLYAR